MPKPLPRKPGQIDFLGVLENNTPKLKDSQIAISGLSLTSWSHTNLTSFKENLEGGKHFSNLPVVISHHGDFRYRGFEYFSDSKDRFVA